MITENLSTLKIHKLTQAQYDRELAAGRLDPTAIYLTPDEEVDLSAYATIEQLNQKADTEHTHDIDDITNIQASLDQLFEDAKAYTEDVFSGAVSAEHNHDNRYYTISDIDSKLDAKADNTHNHNDLYYTKTEFSAMELVSVDDIDAICGTTNQVVSVNGVKF